MIALSVVKPAGDLIASETKSLEIRKWKPNELPLRDLVIVQNEQYLNTKDNPYDPNGYAVAIVDIISVSPWREDQMKESCANYWEEGWLAWEITNVRPMNSPISAPAQLRIYEVDLDS